MRPAIATMAMILATGAVFGQEPVVERTTIWMDAVKRGAMPVRVRGLGVLTANGTAELRIPESYEKQVRLGQAVSVDTRPGIVKGKVARIDPSVLNGMVTVEAKLEGDLPSSARPGGSVDGTIEIATLDNVLFVGRPVDGAADSEGTLFKVDPDGRHAVRVKVQYGQSSVNLIQVRSGLEAGDRVILSDMAAFQARDRLRLQ